MPVQTHDMTTADPTTHAAVDLAEARALLQRLLEAEDRIGRVHLVMDDARAFLARTRCYQSGPVLRIASAERTR